MDTISATPRNYLLGLLSDAVQGTSDWMQSPERTQQLQMLPGLLGLPSYAKTLNKLSYGDSLTNIGKANVPLIPQDTADSALAVAGLLNPAVRGVEATAVAAGKRLAPMVERAVPKIMERGGLPAKLLGDLSHGTTSNAVYGGKYASALDAKYGDKVDAFLSDRDGVTTLSKIVVPKEQRNQGIGTAFMQDLTNMADKDGVTLALSPAGDFGGSVAKLKRFYGENGFVPNKGRNKDFTISESMIRLPETVETPKFTYPQDQALETARQNAVKMLGLPENNTALDRANVLFPNETWHGTDKVFNNFDMAKASQRSQYMPGVFTADNPELASNFGEFLMPLRQRDGVTVLDKVKAKRQGLPEPVVDSIYDKEAGIRVTNNPANIRSRFAAFDPARINENDLLAGMLPFGLLADDDVRARLNAK